MFSDGDRVVTGRPDVRDVEPLHFRRQPCLQQIFLQHAADGGVQDLIDLFEQRVDEATVLSARGC